MPARCQGRSPSSVTIAVTRASPNTSSARSSGSSASTGTYAAPAASTDRIVTYRSFVPEGMRTPPPGHRAYTGIGEPVGAGHDLLGQFRVAEGDPAVVDRGGVGVCVGGAAQDVDEGARGGGRTTNAGIRPVFEPADPDPSWAGQTICVSFSGVDGACGRFVSRPGGRQVNCLPGRPLRPIVLRTTDFSPADRA